ncbi:MAG: hypothetical protein IPK67_10785 [Planctomycetes bacterium]|nr:hypothetical protein [Planctomycetota bacterium]
MSPEPLDELELRLARSVPAPTAALRVSVVARLERRRLEERLLARVLEGLVAASLLLGACLFRAGGDARAAFPAHAPLDQARLPEAPEAPEFIGLDGPEQLRLARLAPLFAVGRLAPLAPPLASTELDDAPTTSQELR